MVTRKSTPAMRIFRANFLQDKVLRKRRFCESLVEIFPQGRTYLPLGGGSLPIFENIISSEICPRGGVGWRVIRCTYSMACRQLVVSSYLVYSAQSNHATPGAIRCEINVEGTEKCYNRGYTTNRFTHSSIFNTTVG